VAEGARLESVFTRKGNVGSNPTLSASSKALTGFETHLKPKSLFRECQLHAQKRVGTFLIHSKGSHWLREGN
jgi:hypothetical protein